MALMKEKKFERYRKKSVIFTCLGSFVTFIFICVIVIGIFGLFVAYVLTDIYKTSNKNAEKLTIMTQRHIEKSQKIISDYSKKISNGWQDFTDFTIESQKNEELIDNILGLIGTGNNYVNIAMINYEGILMSGTFPVNAEKIKLLKLFSNAINGKFGTTCETLNGKKYLIYTAPITDDQGNNVGITVATERGRMDDIFYEYVDNGKKDDTKVSGINVCYVMDADNNNIVYSGIGSDDFEYTEDDKKILKYNDDGDIFEIQIESANIEFGINGNYYDEKSIKEWFKSYHSDESTIDIDKTINNNDNLMLSTIWYKRKIVVGDGLELYTLTQSNVFVDSTTVNKLIFILIVTMIILLIPFILLITSVIRKIFTNHKMATMLFADKVTGYGNWTYFETAASKELKKRKNRDIKFAFISFELNKYRIIVDYYGENTGVKILETISRELKGLLGKKELFARYTESQYGMLLVYEDENELIKRTSRILSILSSQIIGKHISFRAGIFLIEDKKVPISTINLIAAGAKDTGRSGLETQVVMYSSELREKQLREKIIEDSMESALENHEFKVYLQPKYSPETKELVGAEALVRWVSPEKGMISPGEFISIFEKNGFITKLDDYMLREVCIVQADWMAKGRKMVPISVNISRIHFADDLLAEHIKDIVDLYNVPHEYIELELTESAFFDNKAKLLETVNTMHKYGFLVSMDDFGAGYSSLNSLKDLPLDIIKLDGEFFNKTEDAERGETVVTNTITMAKNLNMKIVAEGIETKEQVDFLEKQGCDMIQGFYFARPMPVSDFEKLSEYKE